MIERPKILVVDDELGVREALKLALWKDFDVVVVENAPAALALWRTMYFDGAIVDWILPGMQGDELCLALRKERPGFPIVFLSGLWDLESVVATASRLGVVLFRKPYNVQELRRVLRDLIEASRQAPRVPSPRENTVDDLRSRQLLRMAAIEREALIERLRRFEGNLSAAAISLGMSRRGLQNKMKKEGLARADFEQN